ncbi:GntR family transcriptional regulator [Psychromonas sp. CNPT3]|uniref:GntR family transcriptional regulator n=1 Tax=Psychromonas sp. CNPT3 TaxID=314282 RepID=UPI00006E767C|nr:GntR family transcriptional regulator [Psychromonas sp. CNPT3]AGH81668.1 GntR family transcriptional regulator [Psychromonas sp. CNPT3]
MTDWNNKQPIFHQIKDLIEAQILQGIWQEGCVLPSVRRVAMEMKINHLTVMKAYQLLVDEQIIEKKRGQGMYVLSGAVNKLKKEKKQRFLEEQIPQIITTLKGIDMPLATFIKALEQQIKDGK